MTQAISPLRQRMIDDMRMRKLAPKTQSAYLLHVRRLAAFLGRPPDTACGAGDGTLGPGREEMREAMLVVGHGQFSYPCLVWAGEPLHPIGKADFVALREGEGWCVVEAQQCPDNVARHKVNKLEIALRRQAAPTVAVVDDEAGFADNLGEYLNESGFRASTFYSSAALERELPERTFDGYIVDWILGDRTAEALIKRIRTSANPLAPVFLLTGELSTGLVAESELARVIRQLDVQWREKPIRLATFSAELQRALGHDLSAA